jgi:gliding motility-associated-like protein
VGNSATLTAAVTGGNGPYTYLWSPGGQTIPAIVETYSATGTYNYTATIWDSNGCSGTDTILVSVNSPPSPTITATDTTICAGSTATLTASGGNTYSWSTGSSNTSITVMSWFAGNHNYTVTASNGTGCSATAAITVTIWPLPTISVSSTDTTICSGDAVTLTASGGSVYSWQGIGITNPVVVTPAASSTYTVFGLNSNGCANFTTFTEIISTLSANAGADQTVCPGFTAHLGATISGDITGASYYWSPSNSLNDSSIWDPSANPDSTTYYALEVFNGEGCWGKDTVAVFIVRDAECVIHIYNGITPNGDGNNDTWFIDGIQSFPDNKISIFNRWGTKVWEGINYDNTKVVWKGTNQSGQPLPDGTYYYIVELYDTDGSVLYSRSKWVEVTH